MQETLGRKGTSAQREQGMGVNQAAHGLAGEMGKRERQKLYLQAREPLVGLSCPFPNSNLGHLLGFFFFF